jgi:hypothetical protein
MTDDDMTPQHLDAGWYAIRFKGHLEPRWAAWFDGMCLTKESDGTTRVDGPVLDQAALYGLLQRARDVGLPLISVTQVEPPPRDPLPRSDDPAPNPNPTDAR